MPSFELLSSTKYDEYLLKLKWNNENGVPSPFILLSYHYDRLIDAAERHNWYHAMAALSYEAVSSAAFKAVDDYNKSEDGTASKALKIRLSLSAAGELTATASPVHPSIYDPTSASFFKPSDNPSFFGPVLDIRIDSQPTPISIFTSTKTTLRTVYEEARARADIPPLGSSTPTSNPLASDVLLYNSQRIVTETSIYNIALYRSPFWVTPPLSTGCLAGVMRRWLLEQGRIREATEDELAVENVQVGDWVLLFNGVQGCRLGRIVADS